jgi:hypothetical protein
MPGALNHLFLFVVYLMSLSLSIPYSTEWKNDEERIWEEAVISNLRYYPDMFLDGLRKTKKNQGQDSQCPS